MVTRRAALLGAALCALSALAGAARAQAPTELSTVDGKSLPLGGGGVTHLVFVARWCAPCEAELRAVRRPLRGARREAYELVAVGAPSRQAKGEFVDWARGLGFDGRLVYDEGGRLAAALKTESLPWHVVLGPGGKVLWSAERAPDPASLRAWVASGAKP